MKNAGHMTLAPAIGREVGPPFLLRVHGLGFYAAPGGPTAATLLNFRAYQTFLLLSVFGPIRVGQVLGMCWAQIEPRPFSGGIICISD